VLDGRGGNIEEADLTVGARDQIAARCEVEVGFRGLQQNARDLPALSMIWSVALPMIVAASFIERPELEPPPALTRAVS
jgi:hypothetical protein